MKWKVMLNKHIPLIIFYLTLLLLHYVLLDIDWYIFQFLYFLFFEILCLFLGTLWSCFIDMLFLECLLRTLMIFFKFSAFSISSITLLISLNYLAIPSVFRIPFLLLCGYRQLQDFAISHYGWRVAYATRQSTEC